MNKKHPNANVNPLEDPKGPLGEPEQQIEQSPPTLVERMREQFSGLKAKLIIPYLFLTLLTAMVGTFIVTKLVTSSVRERFFNQLYEASRVASDGVVRQEQEHLAELRLMAFTEGVAVAFQEQDAQILQEILWPLALNDEIEAITAINLDGSELMTLAKDPTTGRYGVYQGTDFASVDIVSRILASDVDELGDKYAGLLNTRFGYYLYSSAPVRDEFNSLVGVLLVGTKLDTLISTLKTQSLADVIILDQSGVMLTSTFPSAEESRDVIELTPASIPEQEEAYTKEFDVAERSYQASYSSVEIRQNQVGLMGVALPSNYVVNAEATSRNTFSLVFSLATLAVIIVGYLLSQSIAKPILKLRSVSKAVADGDLNQRTGFKRSDEIGDLAAVFDLMTLRLRKRTDQAARLYQETLERNEELAEINARLQSTQQQLIQSEKLAAVGQLTAGIVHDVKNPLAVIKGLAEELREEVNLSSTTKDQLVTIRENASRATKIVTDLLKFAGQATPVMKKQNIGETIRTAGRLTDYLARKGNIEVVHDIPVDPVMVTYDATQIEQVLVNLFQNAIQAMPKGGKLRIRLLRTENGVDIKVHDSGVGIPLENQRRVFDPFFTTKGEGEGTGLGLSVSYGIISHHNGRIEVNSEPNKGSVFTVKLPYEQPKVRKRKGI
jgi:signal transduction histidine kinase